MTSISFKGALLLDVLLGLVSFVVPLVRSNVEHKHPQSLHRRFQKHEPKTAPYPLFVIAVLSTLPALLLLPHLQSPLKAFWVSFGTVLLTLVTSITVYRLSPLHPLAAYPGPWQCRLTKLWAAYIAWRGEVHWYYQSLHEKYGEIVRVGVCNLIDSISFTDHYLKARMSCLS